MKVRFRIVVVPTLKPERIWVSSPPLSVATPVPPSNVIGCSGRFQCPTQTSSSTSVTTEFGVLELKACWRCASVPCGRP